LSLTRSPAVAGTFYPSDPDELCAAVDAYLRDAVAGPSDPPPKALIAPHAGYVYSGPVAGSAYAQLSELRDRIERVVLIGPSHRVAISGLATLNAEAFRTPLGDVPVDLTAVEKLLRFPQVHPLDEAHALEHSLEVHLPFLQRVLGEFSLVPLVAGEATTAEVAEVLEAVWGGPETLIVVSSDLSHYYDYQSARDLDAATTEAIETLDPESLGRESACGRVPIRGLLVVAKRHGLQARTLDVRNSGDTAGPNDQVVGYGAYAFG
jgi:hypothetical protein